jgi:hypothetical protein
MNELAFLVALSVFTAGAAVILWRLNNPPGRPGREELIRERAWGNAQRDNGNTGGR